MAGFKCPWVSNHRKNLKVSNNIWFITLNRKNSIPKSVSDNWRGQIGGHIQGERKLQISINFSWHFSDRWMLKSFYMQTQDQWESPDRHLLHWVSHFLTGLAEKFLFWSQLLLPCEQIQTTQKRRYTAVLIWFATLVNCVCWREIATVQVNWDVHTRVISCWSGSTGHAGDIWSQQSSEYPMSNTLAISTICRKEELFLKDYKY